MSTNYGKTPVATGGEIPSCLCRQVMHRSPSRPRLVKSNSRNELWIFCPTCGFKTHPDWCKNSVIAEWCGANKPGDIHIQELWIKRYTEQQNESIALKTQSIGTMVPS